MAVDGAEIERRYRVLFDAAYRPILAYALRRTPNTPAAEDVVAETFLVAWRRIGDVPTDPDTALLWLYGVARRVLANTRRGDARRDRLLARIRQHRTETTVASLEDIAERAGQHQAVIAAFGRLRPEDIEILQLAMWEQLSHAQIAVILDRSVNAVGIRLHRARKAFADQLAKEDPETGHIDTAGPPAAQSTNDDH